MGHPSRPCHSTGMPRSPSGDKPDDYSLYGSTDLENQPLLLKGWTDLYQMWKRGGFIITDRFTIKYAAGISYNGYQYFRDKRLPKVMTIDGKDIEYDLFWFCHELTELGMAKWMGTLKDHVLIASDLEGHPQHHSNMGTIPYLVAHQQAETVENALVKASGIDLDKYNAQCQVWVDWLVQQPLEKSPSGLSLYPYRDAKDYDTLNEIVATGGPVSAMMLPVGVEGGETDAPWNGD